MKSHGFAALAIGLIALTAVTLAAQPEKGTIITKSGQKYEEVLYQVDFSYKLITVILDEEKKKNISFTQIEAIIREDGTDITAEVLKGYYKPADKEAGKPAADTSQVTDTTALVPTRQPVVPVVDSAEVPPTGRPAPAKRPLETWKSKDDEIYRRARILRWNASFGLTGNYSIPSGKYYEGVDPAVGFGVAMRLAVSHNLAIGIDISRPGYDFGEDLEGYDPETGMLAVMEVGLSTMRYTILAEYYRMTSREGSNLNMTYFYTGLGAIKHKTDWTIVEYDELNQRHLVDKGATNESKFITIFGLGARFTFDKNVGVDIGADLFVVFLGKTRATEQDFPVEVYQHAANIDLRCGLIIFLSE
ncbi:MAG: hypothetical protein OEW00_02670 [candidate division Zixibacteria bacterium]|nr:hypothetical protein [candidate division Zixibacteria bacterium]